MKVEINGRSIYYDGYLKNNLDTARKIVDQDWDMVFIVDGLEGAGKSVLAQQVAYYLDPSLSIDRICFTPTEFKEAIKKASKHQAIIFDEAFRGLSSRASISEVNQALVTMLAEIRQKNLFVFIVIPCFFELDRYPAIWRSRALLHVYTGKEFQRGYFGFYNVDKKKILYMNGKKFYNYTVLPNFRGRFTKGYCVPEAQYRAKKLKSLEEPEKLKKIQRRTTEQRDVLLWYLKYVLKVKTRDITKVLAKDNSTKLGKDQINRITKDIADREG